MELMAVRLHLRRQAEVGYIIALAEHQLKLRYVYNTDMLY